MSIRSKIVVPPPARTDVSPAVPPAVPKSRLQRIVSSPVFLGGYIALLVVCALVIEETHRRMFPLPGVERHFYFTVFLVIMAAFVLAYAAALAQVLDATSTWRSRLLFGLLYLPITFRWVVFLAVGPLSVAEALQYFLPRTPVTYDATVLESDGYRHRGSRIGEVTFVLPGQGRVRLTETDWKPAHLFFHPMLVNGVCPLDRLPTGLPITIHVRHSSLGDAIDSMTSTQPCLRAAD